MTLIYAIILFVLLIFPHELGHFLVAKAVGVKVNEFSFGMGPAIFQRQKGETLYSIRIIPIGGYCAMEGENGDSDDERSFGKKPVWAKLSVLLAGAWMNILIAIIVLSLMMGIIGTPTTIVDQVKEGSPAYTAGIQTGDRIVEIDHKEIKEWKDVATIISEEKTNTEVILHRDDREIAVNVTPTEAEDGRMVIGVVAKNSHNAFTAISNGFKGTWNMTKGIFSSFKMLISGDAPASDIAGPIGIITMVNDTNQYGLYYFGFLIALISLNLAIINLLPFPALDGGRILFVFIRAITGRKITDEMEGKVHMIGMMLLIALLIFATWNDIARLFA